MGARSLSYVLAELASDEGETVRLTWTQGPRSGFLSVDVAGGGEVLRLAASDLVALAPALRAAIANAEDYLATTGRQNKLRRGRAVAVSS